MTTTDEWEVVTGANSVALDNAIVAKKATYPDSFKVIGFACKSDGSAFYALIQYRKTT